jgi:hypothetical protein
MTIDVARIETEGTVCIGCPANPLFEGDTLEDVTVIAEGFLADGTPINPAPFASDDGGWEAEVVMDTESDLDVTVDNPLFDDGQIILRLTLNESSDKDGKHAGIVRISNPIGARTQQRSLFNFVVKITDAPG